MFKQLQSLRRGPLLGSLMFTLLSFLFVNNVSAQLLGAYSFLQSGGAYTHLTGGTNSTATGDDGSQNGVPLGFNFTFEGNVYTHACINTNGWIKLGDASTTIGFSSFSNELNYNNTAHEPLIAGLWDDNNRNTGSISYLMTGSAPNRVFEVNYDTINLGGSGATSSTSKASFLIRVYETTNIVEIIYGPTLGTAGSLSASVGLTGLSSYASVTPGATATVSNSSANNSISSTTNLVNQRYLFIPPPPTPPTPTEAVGPPTCSAGITIDMVGPPPADIQWYWQTTATGTSTANLYSGPYTVFANGTYYARALNTVTNTWSLASSSVTISDFPTATPPTTPTAGANPACVTSGTDLTVDPAPVGYVYYWQGTTVNGSSMALDASTPYHVSTTGTYNVAAYETASGCWSNTVGLAVTVSSYIPAAPTTTLNNYNICSGTPSQMIDATPPPGGTGGTASANTGTISVAIPDANTTGITNNLAISGIPADGVISQVSVQLSITHTFDADLDIFLKGPNGTQIELSTDNGSFGADYINTVFTNTASTSITTAIAPMTGTFLPEGDLTSLLSIPNGTWTLAVQDDASGDVGTLTNWSINITYTQNPVSTLAWYDASAAGTLLGTTSPFETVGTSLLPNTNTGGSYVFYAESQSMGCTSTRIPVTINVTEVLAMLNPVNVTCNGGDNGSFTLGTVQCGTGPFEYSLDNGVTFGPIPTNLIAGTYQVIMRDIPTSGLSAPISVNITQPGAPTALNATNITYYNATLSWTPAVGDGTTSWTIIYGTTGFDPSTSGTVIPNVTSPYTISGDLLGNTAYDFYVLSDCGSNPDTVGPASFATDAGFLTWDNACIPFVDISATGTNLNLSDDSEAGLTLPWPWNFNGTTVNTITVGNNGGIVFNTLTANIAYPGVPTDNGLYPYNQDLNTALSGGGVFYKSIGTAPNRQFIIEWKDLAHYNFPASTDGSTFELIYDEATTEVYFLYQDVLMSNTSWNYGAAAQILAVTSGTGSVMVSSLDATYLTSNSCVHFFNQQLCPEISNVTSLIFNDDAILDWNAGLYGETNWTVIYGLEGFDPAVPGEAIDTFEIATIAETGFGGTLEQLTTYDVYIYSECQADGLTSGGYFYQFTTLPNCSNPSNLAGMTDVDSIELAWNWTAAPGYPATAFNIRYGMNGSTPISIPAAGTNNADTIVNPALIAGGVYQVYLQAECSASNDTSSWVGPITVIMPLSNDTVCGAETLALGTTYTLNNVGAGVSIDETNIAPPATGAQTTTGWANSTLNNTTWFKFVAPASGSVRINNTAISYNGQAAVYTVADCGDFNSNFLLVAANDDAIGGTSAAPNFTICGLTPNNTYYLLHDGTGTTGNYSIMITPIVLEAGSANPLTKICTGSSIDLFTTITGNDANGVWSAPIAASNASITGSTFSSTGLGYEVFNFQYRMTDGCAYDSIVSQVQVYGNSNAGTNGTLTVCKNEPVDLLSGLGGTVDVDGTWYDPSHTALTSSAIDASQFPGSFNYDYVTSNGVCPADSSQVTVVVLSNCNYLSVDEAVFEGVQLYPNPTSGIINIDADKAFTVNVTDANGRTVKSDFNSTIGTTTIDLSKVQVGVYFVTLRNETATKVFRVVVQ